MICCHRYVLVTFDNSYFQIGQSQHLQIRTNIFYEGSTAPHQYNYIKDIIRCYYNKKPALGRIFLTNSFNYSIDHIYCTMRSMILKWAVFCYKLHQGHDPLILRRFNDNQVITTQNLNI